MMREDMKNDKTAEMACRAHADVIDTKVLLVGFASAHAIGTRVPHR